MQNIVYDLIKVFPNIISNSVNYTNIKIPSHWKVSDKHQLDIKDIVKIMKNNEYNCKTIKREYKILPPYWNLAFISEFF